ncbi:MAG: hypothetical protein FJY26_10635 [Betaproteobacteria bacterium]|nr:hypothetical protein [Betaproteobacteria bacterium]
MSSPVTKIFILAYFLPAWFASLMSWGEQRTSEGFEAAPEWFQIAKFGVQITAILILFIPLKLRSKPSLSSIVLAVVFLLSTSLADPVLEAEFILLSSSVQIGLLALFLLFFKPSADFGPGDLRFLFLLFVIGFLLQTTLYFGFDQLPSHSITNVIVRFNGVTNDSLSTGILLTLLVPWAVVSAHRLSAVAVLFMMSALTGSLFSIIAVLSAVLCYLVLCRLYIFASTLIIFLLSLIFLLKEWLIFLFDVKLLSIVTHMRVFINFFNMDLNQPTHSCSVEFCESFLEVSWHLSPVYGMLFYGLMYTFKKRLFSVRRPENDITRHSLFVFWLALMASTFVHPLPLIPFATPLFLIFCILYANRHESYRFKDGLHNPRLSLS